jgi:phosphatidylglycerophosphate synthase
VILQHEAVPWGLLAHGLTGARIALAPVFVACVWAAHHGLPAKAWIAAVAFAFAALSDILDGRWARRSGSDRAWARWFDHGADIGFIVPAFSVYTAVGLAPWWVPASVLFAFTAYVVRSRNATSPRRVAFPDRVGHWGGVANYVLVGVLVVNCTLQVWWLPKWALWVVYALVPLYSTAPLWLPWFVRPRASQGSPA